ncbi:MAG: phenylacetate-CoA oxygenase subunit PaaJ [Burkholderiales bacterium]|nr:phenylacetate-CoA oxygenase subunit PaaJ [Burkholderiales bacterium]
MDAGRSRPRRQAGRAHRASRASADRDAVPAARVPGRAVVSVDRVWDALATVPDPEVPAVSIVELGIVRGVSFAAGRLRVKLTPTYSGCPATDVIAGHVRERLAAIGFPDAELATALSPPWTTDWIAPEGRRKLAAFGIAPPHVNAGRVDVAGISPLRRAGVAVRCPRCASTRTTLLSQFGSTACKAQYRCDACLEPFDYFKPH